ncbi:MAG: PAS domain S-box protein [Pseudomonadota bacterium]
METIQNLKQRIHELERLLAQAETKSDILTNLLKEATTEFNQTLEKISTSNVNFRAIIDNAPEAIYILGIDTRCIIDCNPYTVQWLGYSRRELLSRRIEDILEPGTMDVIENMQKAKAFGFIHIQERRFRKKDGSIVDAELTGMVVEMLGKECLVTLARDITQRKQYESLLRYKELFENVLDPVFITHPNGLFLEVNDVTCDRLGYTRGELMGMTIMELVPPSQMTALQQMAQKIHSGETVQFELEVMTRGGKVIPFELHSRRIDFQRVSAILGVARDVSVRKKMEERLIQTERLSAVGEMASGVAHNFNNLLQMILGAGEAACQKLDAGEIRKSRAALNTLIEACRRGADIVNRIKKFTIAKGEEDEKHKVFDLGNLVSEAVQLTKPLWADPAWPRKYRLNCSTAQGCRVKGNPSEIYEVLVNSIKNGIEAMPDGGALAICSETLEGKVRLSITDTGQGISEENLQRIFQPFFTTKGKKSCGLGLSSSYGIIKKHWGDMTVKSISGKGTTFFITLPLASPDVEEPCRGIDTNQDISESKIKLLVIDDEKHILEMMAMFFEDTAIELYTANSAVTGLSAICNGVYDVILCDFGMDEMNGLEIGKAALDHACQAGRPKTPFLLYTGYDKNLNSARLEKNGIDRIVHKPVSGAELLRIIQEMTNDKDPLFPLADGETHRSLFH